MRPLSGAQGLYLSHECADVGFSSAKLFKKKMLNRSQWHKMQNVNCSSVWEIGAFWDTLPHSLQIKWCSILQHFPSETQCQLEDQEMKTKTAAPGPSFSQSVWLCSGLDDIFLKNCINWGWIHTWASTDIIQEEQGEFKISFPWIFGGPVSKQMKHFYKQLLIWMVVMKRCSLEFGEGYSILIFSMVLGNIWLSFAE